MSKKQRKKLKKQERDEAANPENDTDGIQADPYDVEECKRILRSHKLKVAVLEDFAPQVEESRKEKKSKKRKKEKEGGTPPPSDGTPPKQQTSGPSGALPR